MIRNPVIDSEFYYGATPEILYRASQLRRNMTYAEKCLWEKLRAKKVLGLTFRRQHPVNMFIADFYCHRLKLVIEIDGSIHEIENYRIRDFGREDEFEKFGLATIRFTNEEVINDIDAVLKKITEYCERRLSEKKLNLKY